jgi:hypothetical protein
MVSRFVVVEHLVAEHPVTEHLVTVFLVAAELLQVKRSRRAQVTFNLRPGQADENALAVLVVQICTMQVPFLVPFGPAISGLELVTDSGFKSISAHRHTHVCRRA